MAVTKGSFSITCRSQYVAHYSRTYVTRQEGTEKQKRVISSSSRCGTLKG